MRLWRYCCWCYYCYCCYYSSYCCCFTCVRTVRTILLFYDRSGQKIETGETWSIFNVLNWNWAGCSLELNVPYESAVRLYGSTQGQSLKRAFVFEIIAWSSMIWIILYIIFLALWSLYCSADWIGILMITSATILCNSVLLYSIPSQHSGRWAAVKRFS